jgi:hypothetical protein
MFVCFSVILLKIENILFACDFINTPHSFNEPPLEINVRISQAK